MYIHILTNLALAPVPMDPPAGHDGDVQVEGEGRDQLEEELSQEVKLYLSRDTADADDSNVQEETESTTVVYQDKIKPPQVAQVKEIETNSGASDIEPKTRKESHEKQPNVPSKRSNPRLVTSLREGMNFQEDALTFLQEDISNSHEFGGEDVLENLQESMRYDSLSTAYSGIEAASTATNLVARAVARQTGKPMNKIPLLHMIEWDPESAKECQLISDQYEPDSPCVFGNIASFYRVELQPMVRSLRESLLFLLHEQHSYTVLYPVYDHPNS